MLNQIKALWHDEEGATMVEYALMLALIAVVCIGVVTALGQKTGETFDASNSAIGTATPVTVTNP